MTGYRDFFNDTATTEIYTLPLHDALPIFGGINNAKFRKQVVPGDVLRLEVEITKVKGPVGYGKGVATVDGKKAVSAEISFAIK